MKKLALALATVLLAACTSNTDLYDEHAKEKDLKAQYSENFQKKYSNVNLNQSWDYSNKNEAYSLPSSTPAATRATRAADYKLTQGDEYEVDPSTLTWLKKKLPDQHNNRSLGKPFYMTTPGNSFTIVPIFQGRASSIWELHAVVNGVDMKVWEKCQDIWAKKTADSDWQTVSSLSNTELYKNTENAAAVKAKTYNFENIAEGVEIYFYLVVTKVTNQINKSTIGRQMSSLNGMMLSLNDCPRPANIDESYNVSIIACEDVDTSSSDNDMNDVVFMVIGKPEVPNTIEITEDTEIEKRVTVRYMIEDLGATDDFDFNDIVIDVADVWTSKPRYSNGVLNGWTDSNQHQEAIIRHLGGTLPFKLKIGNTELEEHAGVLGSNPDEKYEVSGWSKTSHNISVQVKQSQNSTVYNNVVFPKSGEAPMIIAVEPTQEWMQERVSVPEDWFTVPEE